MQETDPKKLAKRYRQVRKHLTDLTTSVGNFLALLDREMKQPSTVERGKRIAELANKLEMANDQARYFGLGIDYRIDAKRKARMEKG